LIWLRIIVNKLLYAKLYEGEEELKTNLVCFAFRKSYEFHRKQGNFDEALIFAEEAYNCVATVYNPVHPKVQKSRQYSHRMSPL
jgi:hypothetical protein